MVRVKRRYVLVKHSFQSASQLSKATRDIVTQLYGDFGASCLLRGFAIKKFNQAAGEAILSTRKGTHEMLMGSLPIIIKPTIQIIKLSGTVRGCLKSLEKIHRMHVRKMISDHGRLANDTQ